MRDPSDKPGRAEWNGERAGGRLAALRIVLVYALFAGAWILLSDYALGLLFRDPALIVRLSAGKGLLFVVVTSLLLHPLITGYIRQTRRKEAALRAGEARFRSYVEHAPMALFVMDREGRVTDANPAAARMFGCAAEGLPDVRLADLAGDDERARIRSDMRELGTGATVEREYTLRSTDGRVVLLSLRAVRLDQSTVLAFGTDVTEERKTADALRASEEQLQQARKMEAVGRLAGGIAHDFNNLLTVIGGYADLIDASLPAADPTRPGIREIQRAARRAADLTTQLLAFSRRQVLQPRVIDLNEVIRGMEDMLRRVIREDIELATSLAPDLGTVRADRGQIEQVMMNLAANARDAMPRGGRFTIETSRRVVEPGPGPAAGSVPGPSLEESVCLRVSDSGTGMDPETLARIFEPFFTTKEQGKGTGLGLATVYGIVTQSGGQIRCESQPGKGSTFLITFPVAGGRADEPDSPAPRGLPRTRGEVILLVEDEDSVRRYVASVLEGAGYRVISARDGVEAFQTISSGGCGVQLLLSDVVMPMMSGPELGERARALCPGLPILYMSGFAESSIVHHGVLDPGVNLIMKPFEAHDLLGRIRALLETPDPAA